MRYLVTINGKQHEVQVDLLDGTVPAAVSAPVSVPTPTPVTAVPQPAVSAAADEKVLSPMPGNIWEVQVTVGQQVAAGQSLVILEAMKMENEIVAPRAGMVKQILVSKGAAVNTNDVLVVLN